MRVYVGLYVWQCVGECETGKHSDNTRHSKMCATTPSASSLLTPVVLTVIGAVAVGTSRFGTRGETGMRAFRVRMCILCA